MGFGFVFLSATRSKLACIRFWFGVNVEFGKDFQRWHWTRFTICRVTEKDGVRADANPKRVGRYFG